MVVITIFVTAIFFGRDAVTACEKRIAAAFPYLFHEDEEEEEVEVRYFFANFAKKCEKIDEKFLKY